MIEWIYDLKSRESLYRDMDAVTLLRQSIRIKERRRRRRRSAPDSRYLSLSEAAGKAGFSRDTMLRYAKRPENEIDFAFIEGRYWIDRRSLESYLDRVKVPVKRKPGRKGRPRIYQE